MPEVKVPLAVGVVEALTVIEADCVTEGVVVEAAVMITLPAVAGAVKVVLAPLAVWAGLNVPQDPEGVQLQSAPAFALSFETVAAIVAVPLAAIVEGGAVDKAIEILAVLGGGVFVDTGVVDDETAPQPEKDAARNKAPITVHFGNPS